MCCLLSSWEIPKLELYTGDMHAGKASAHCVTLAEI